MGCRLDIAVRKLEEWMELVELRSPKEALEVRLLFGILQGFRSYSQISGSSGFRVYEVSE